MVHLEVEPSTVKLIESRMAAMSDARQFVTLGNMCHCLQLYKHEMLCMAKGEVPLAETLKGLNRTLHAMHDSGKFSPAYLAETLGAVFKSYKREALLGVFNDESFDRSFERLAANLP